MSAVLTRIARRGGALATFVGATGTAHLLLLLGAALRGRREAHPTAGDGLRLAVVIPAHDEEGQIEAAVRSVQAVDYPTDQTRIIVVADNCRDRTAKVAAQAGAEVWERTDSVNRGKGHALAWAFNRIVAAEDTHHDAICVVDADCEVTPNLLRAFAARLGAGADAVQASYLVSDPSRSTGAALRWAGFALFNVVRPLGRERLGLSSGLLGTGMAISSRLLAHSPWRSFSFAEDREQHMRWVLSGARVAFAPEATVRSPAASDHAGRHAQEARWESGRLRLAASLSPALLRRAVRHREPRAFDAALEPVLPPQSLLLAANVVAVGLTTATRSRLVGRFARASLVGQIIYVVGSLAAVRAPLSVWRALLSVPVFVLRRLSVLGGALGAGRPSEWERTARAPATESAVTDASSTDSGSSALVGATTEMSAAGC